MNRHDHPRQLIQRLNDVLLQDVVVALVIDNQILAVQIRQQLDQLLVMAGDDGDVRWVFAAFDQLSTLPGHPCPLLAHRGEFLDFNPRAATRRMRRQLF